jgi:hypothetical protein
MLYPILSGFIHSDIHAIFVHSDHATMSVEPAPSKKMGSRGPRIRTQRARSRSGDYNEAAGIGAAEQIVAIHNGFKKAWGG